MVSRTFPSPDVQIFPLVIIIIIIIIIITVADVV